jgi:hypothetical protein
MLRLAAPAVLIALALAGCTQQQSSDTGDFSGEEAKVAGLVGDLSDAAAKGDDNAVCSDILSATLQEEVAGDESCISEVGKAFDDADATVIDVDDVTVTGEKATAEVSSKQLDGRVTRTFSFVKEDGDWRISSFG